jgi:choline dehydrogenase-like flavoprotein
VSGFIRGADALTSAVDEVCDVCIIGSGAGGATLAAGLCEAGLSVVLLEAGGHFTRQTFSPHEGEAYPALYQDRGTRATADLAITILQGRAVGGSTTVNWTTCYRTPSRILAHWAAHHAVEGLTDDALRPHFEAVEARLSIAPWPVERANANNRALLNGAAALGWPAAPTSRNVKGCANSGLCGLGCPVDGKQSMLVTSIPDAVSAGLRLYADVEARRVVVEGGRVVRVEAEVVRRADSAPTGVAVTVRPKVLVLSGGAINTPALLLRSGINTNGRVGLRTFLHPVIAVAGRYPERIDGFYGAPQSVASHHLIDRGPERVGLFFEAGPVQPMLIATATPLFGEEMAAFMAELAHVSGLISLAVDGLLPGDDGGTVRVDAAGRPRVDYPIRPALAEAFRAGHEALAQVHLAAGATEVYTLHRQPRRLRSTADIAQLAGAPYGAHEHAIFTAHQMGGCAMGEDPSRAVVRSDLRHHSLPNLFVVDGSVLPTSLGVNPSQTIYALAHRARAVVAAAV